MYTSRKDRKGERQPLVSVIIPAYNAADFIIRTLRSVSSQTYPFLEALVVDDGSTDETRALVRQYIDQDNRVKLLCQPNAGVAAARNLAIENALGELIAPIDADDIWGANHIDRQVQTFLLSPSSVGLVYSWSIDIDEDDRPTGGQRAAEIEGNVFTTLICHNFIGNASATMFLRTCLRQVGYYETTLRDRHAQGCEDWELYLRIAEKFEFRAVPVLSVGYRKLSDSMSCNYERMSLSHGMVMDSVKERHPELQEFLFGLSKSNLYFYFAHENQLKDNQNKALIWLLRAIQADPITCWIRPGLYLLLIQIVFRHRERRYVWMSESKRRGIDLESETVSRNDRKVRQQLTFGKIFHLVISSIGRRGLGPEGK